MWNLDRKSQGNGSGVLEFEMGLCNSFLSMIDKAIKSMWLLLLVFHPWNEFQSEGIQLPVNIMFGVVVNTGFSELVAVI